MVESAGGRPAVRRGRRAANGLLRDRAFRNKSRRPDGRRDASNSSLAVACALLFVLSGLIAAAPAGAQDPVSDVSLATVSADDPFTVDGDDRLHATIENREPVAVSGSVHFHHPDASTTANRFATIDVDVPAHANRTVSLAWDGRIFGTALADEQPIHATLTLDAMPGPVDEERVINVTFLHHAVDVAAVAPAETTVAPGGIVQQTVAVTNTGNRADNFTLAVADTTPGWTFYLDEIEVNDVAPGDTQSVTLTVVAPRDAAAGAAGSANVTARAFDHLPAADTARSHSFAAADDVDFNLTAVPADQVIEAGDTLRFDVRAANLGNQPLDLTFEAPPGVHLDDDELSLAPGANDDVAASSDVPDEIVAGTYVANVTATDADSGTTRHAWAVAHVPHEPAFALSRVDGASSPVEIAPASQGTIVVELENQGNAIDRYDIALEALPSGWTYETDADVVLVPPGLALDVAFHVSVPAGTDADTYELTATAVRHDEAAAPASVVVSVEVPPTAVPALTVTQPMLPIEEEGTADFSVMVRNRGNAAGEFELQDPDPPESAEPEDGWSAQWVGTTTFELEAGASEPRTLRVTAPSTLDPEGEAVYEAAVNVGDVAATVRLVAQEAAPDLSVVSIGAPAHLDMDKPAVLEVLVRNVGSVDVESPFTVLVNATHDGVEVFVHEAEIDGLAWQAGDNEATVTVPWTPSDRGEHVVTATVDPDDEVSEKHGDADDPAGNNNATLETFVRVEDLVLVAPPAGFATPGQRVLLDGDAAFEIRNLGNVDEYIRVTGASGPPGWSVTPVPSGPLWLFPDETVRVNLVVDAPAAPGPDDAAIQVHVATDRSDLSGVVLLRIEDTVAPEILNVSVTPEAGMLGQPVTVVADVADDTSVAWVQATLTAANGVQSRIALAPDANEADRWTGVYVPQAPGPHRAHVIAADAANVASTQGNPHTFDVVVDPTPPLILFLAPATDGGPVKGASGLNFTVADAYGVANVTYRVHAVGNTSDVRILETVGPQARYRVPLDGMSEQSLMVSVHAENIFGVAADANRTFRIDNTPPILLDVRYVMQKDGGFRVTADVGNTSDLSAVEVRLRLSDGSLERVLMENSTVRDRYVANVGARNLTAWWVAAWDRVGNEAIEEFAPPEAGSAAGAGGSSPAWTAHVALAALVLVAIARVRRVGR